MCEKEGLDTVDDFKQVVKKGSKIVQYFNLVTIALTKKQEQFRK